MLKRLFVGNLPFSMTEAGLKELFEIAGPVVSARIIVDRETQRPKGFGFVEFERSEAASAAIAKFSGTSIGGRVLIVTEARPREAAGSARR
ncbi:MAG TPA: RNA-binding protein [Verrucomicrobiae bacterium]|nr:RNA-binding protein [Verrucomicrobiae bacterium]